MSRITTIGFRRETKLDRESKSHVLCLAIRLLALGVIKHFSFIWVNFQHDDGCRTLSTAASLDCVCNCEAVIGGRRYSFNKYVRDAERVQ
jgi:hypothetical protein